MRTEVLRVIIQSKQSKISLVSWQPKALPRERTLHSMSIIRKKRFSQGWTKVRDKYLACLDKFSGPKKLFVKTGIKWVLLYPEILEEANLFLEGYQVISGEKITVAIRQLRVKPGWCLHNRRWRASNWGYPLYAKRYSTMSASVTASHNKKRIQSTREMSGRVHITGRHWRTPGMQWCMWQGHKGCQR